MARLNGARLLMLEKEKDKVVREVPVRTGQVQIGSNPMLNMIRLNSDGVEPIHCKIFVKNEKVFIANYSTANPISVDNSVVPKRAVLHDGSILEICGTRFRWKFDESKLAAVNRPEKAKKTEQTPTSSKYGNRRRTTMVRKKQPVVTATAGGSGKKAAAKKNAQQNRTPTYTLPKNHKQLLRNIRKRFTVHNIITRNNSDDVADEEDADCEESAIPEVAESSKPVTPTKSSSTTSSAANTPFYTPEPEKENSVPVTKTPKTPMFQLENSAMMILSYTPAIGSRSKANIQKTPLSVAKSAQRLNYLTPKNENVSTNATPLKSKAGNSMYLIDLTTPNSGHSSFVCSPMLDTTASSIGSPKLRLIDLTTPSPKKAKTPASVLKSTQQKTLLKSALKNASKTPRTALRTGTGTPVTPKAVPKISLNDTPTKSAVSTRSNKTPASSTKGSSIRSKLETPVSSKKVDSARKQMTPVTSTVSQSESTPQKEISIMTTDELFDTLVGRQSNVKTYERKSTSPKKTPCPLVVAEGTTELPKTDIDIWVESVVAAVTSPESVSMDAIIRKPNQTTQVRSSQYSDITPHESFAEATSTSEVVDTQPEVGPVSSLDELDNITDGPTIPNSGRRSDTPLASKIARSLGNKRQTIGNFFTNIFGKLTVSPVTRISIADDSLNQSEDQKPSDQGDDSDGSEEVYHDSETDHGLDVPQPTNESVASSPKLRQSLRDTRKFIGNAWTSLNTSRPQLDNTAEIDESLLLSDTYNETKTDAGNNTVDEDYDLTDLGSRPATAQLPVTSPAKTPTLRQSVKLTEAFDISPLATPLESTPNKTGLQVLDRNTTGSFVISPDATLPGTPVSRRSQASTPNVTSGFTPSKRSTRRQTGSTDISSVVPTEDTENVEDIAHSQSASDQLQQSVHKSPNQSLNVDVAKEQVTEHIFVEMSQDVVAATVSDIMANEQGEEHEAEEPYQSVPEDIGQESLGEVTEKIDEVTTGEPTNKDDSIALETSEMEPLEVTGGYESDVHPATPSSKDLVSSKRATRNSIATLKVVTPQSSISAVKVPMSESKLPLRGLQKAIVGTSEESPTKQSEDTFREVDLLKQSNESIKPTVAVGEESSVEQSTNIDKSITACDDQDEVTHVEAALNEITTPVDELDGNDSIANLDISNLNAARRRTRKSLASMTITPKATVAPLNKVPMSESKLPLRVLRKTMVETSEKSSETPSGKDSVGNFDLLEDSYIGKGDIADVGNGSVVEKSIEINKSMTACNDKVANVESESNEFIPCSEATLPEDDHVTPTVKSSQASVEPDLSTVEDTAVFDSSVNLETINLNVSARRSTRKSLATTTITPKAIAAPLSKVPMSESKLPLRRLRATETSILEETVEQSPCLEENSNAADPDQAPAFLEILEINQSSTPVPASPGRPSRSSARSTPQKLSNTTISKSTPSGTAPLLKRVLQKVIKDSATKTVVVQSPKPNDSAADTSLHLDQLYRTPTLRVTHGKVIATSTPNIVDESLKLNELYETPTRVTRGNAPQLEKGNGDESLASSSLHLDNLYGSPAHSVASREDSEIAVEDKLELSTVDNTLNLQDLYTTPAQTLRDVSQFSEVPETHYENASSNVEADVSLNLLKAPTQINIEQPTANNAKPPMEVDTNLHKTPARSVTSSDVTRESAKENVDMSLNLQELYKTPTQQTQEPISTGAADEGHTLQQLHKTRHSVVVKGSLKSVSEPQSSADMSLNLQELYKTPARPIRSTAVTSTSKHTPKDAGNADRCMVTESQPDMSLNLQDLYKTPTGTVRTVQQSVVKNIATPKKDVAQADASLNLQEMYKTPSSTNKSTPKGAATADLLKVKEPQSNTSLNLHDLYKTPARSTRNATVASTSKGTSKAAVDGNKAAELQPDVSLNLQELYKTPARTLRTNTQQSAAKNMATPMGEDADASLPNLQQLYKTPARSTRSAALASTSKSTPKTAEESKPDVSLNLQELYKTPARTLRGVSKLTPANTSKLNTPVVEPVQREPEADVSLNLDQLYKTPARQVRGTTQMSAIKHVKVSEVTPLKTVEKAGMDVTPTVESSKIQRTPIANVSESEANMTLNLEQMYKTPARQLSDKEKVEADTTLNLDQLYKTPAHSLSGVTQLTAAKASTPATDAKSEAEENLNLQELYQTPARMLQGDKSQSSAIKESNQTPALTQHNTTTQAEESNLNVDLLFKTPARTTRARLPRSSAKAAATDATPVTNTPSCTPRSTSSRLTSATPAASTSRVELSMAESELVSSIVDEESMNMGSESDGLATGKAISSTPFNPRTRKSTLVATVGMMSPLNSSGDGTMTMHTEAIGITTIQDMSTAADSTTVDQMQTMAGVFVAAQSRLLYDESGLQSTMLGDPLQVTNVLESPAGTQSEDSTCVEAITATQQDKTTEDAAVESLLEQNETLTKTTSSAKATESRDCSVSTTTAAEEVEDTIQELPKADASLVLNQSNSSPARTLRNSRFVAETPVAKSTFVSKCTESDVSICLNIPETPARMSEKLTSPNTPSAVFEPKSPPVQSPAVSPKVSSTLASSAKKSTSVTPKTIPARLSFTSLESKSSSTSKQRRSVTVKNSVTEQELATVPDKVTEITNEPGSPSVECKSIENVPDNSVSADPADATALKNSVTNLSVPESSTVEAINAVTLEVACTTENQTVAAEPYLDANNSLGVDEALLQQIRERVTTLERELEEMDNGTHGSSTFLERSDDSQEVSEVEIKLDDKTPKPKKRQLYTKVVPDDNTPERRESIGDLRSTSSKHVYVETASSDKKADTSSEVDESKKVEIPVKVLPSRASRRKITTLSEEALAGASPELKFVKPKPPKVVPSEVTPSINTSSGNTSETEVSDQETSLGRRKVAFNDHIQVKEINSPAFVGEIIKKTSQRGRGRNTKKVVTVTVDQTLTQSIKPATKRGKPVEPEELPAEEVEHGKVEVTQQASDKVETVELEQKPDQIAEELSEVIAPIDEPAAKRSRSKKASAAKRTTSKAKVEDPTSTSDEPEVAKPTAKRSRRGAKTEATEVIETTKDATDETNDEVEQISDVPDSEPFANTEEEVLEDTKEPSEQSEGVLEVPVDEPVIKRNRSKKAPAAKRTVSRTKIEDHASTSDGKPDEPEIAKPTAKRARRGAKINTADVAETVVEAADEDTNVSKEQAVNVQASCNEGKSSEPEAAAIKPTAKRLRRGANADASDVTGAKDAEKPAEVEQSVNEPISKRIRHAPETKTDPAVEKPIDDKEDRIKERDQIDEVQSATKAPSRSRRGKKQVETSVKTVDVPAGPEVASPVKVQEIEQASKTLEVKSRSRRGANTKETHAEVIVHTESSEDAPAEVKESTDSTMEFAGGKKEDIETMVENDGAVENAAVGALKPEQTAEKTHETMESKEETKPRSGRSGTKAKITEKRAPANEDTPVEIQNTKQAKSRRAAKKQPTEDESVAKETEDVSSSATDSHEEKSSAQIRSAAKKTTRKGRGAVKNTTVESATAISASLVVEKAVADSTSHEDPSVDAEVDAKSNAKRSRRGAKDESEATEAKDEPTTKRSRRAPKSSAEQVTEAHAESVDVIEEPKTTSRSRRTQKQGTDIASSAVEKSATKRTKQDESQQESTVEQQEALEAEDKPASRRGAKKKASEEESSARMPSPTLAPPAVDEQPAKRTGRQAARRAPKKANNPDPTPVEMSMNESHMVKTVLPASHTSTPLAKTAANADNEVPSATRGRRAANPVIAALIEQSTPNTRSRRGASATPTVVQVETPSTPVRRGRGAASKAKAAEDETPQPNNAESETSTNRGRKTKDKEVVEPAPVAKRARKVPSKLRDETDDDLGAKKVQPTRGRRGAKAKTEESNAADEDETVEVSAGPSEEQPKKKGRATAKRTVKKADLNEESVPVEEEAEEEKAPKSPPPKRSRKGAR